MTKFVNRHTVTDGSSLADVLIAMLQYDARGAVAATALTDSSSGTADTDPKLAVFAAVAVDTAATGSNLADKTTTEAAMTTVLNAHATLYAKANTAATVLGLTNVTNNGGGASGGNTVAAVTKTVTGAATGVPAAAWNTFQTTVQNSMYNLAILANKLASATGQTVLDVSALKGNAVNATIAAISTATGTAASPGTLQTRVQADLTVMANNVATVAARLNTVIAGAGKPGAVALPTV